MKIFCTEYPCTRRCLRINTLMQANAFKLSKSIHSTHSVNKKTCKSIFLLKVSFHINYNSKSYSFYYLFFSQIYFFLFNRYRFCTYLTAKPIRILFLFSLSSVKSDSGNSLASLSVTSSR